MKRLLKTLTLLTTGLVVGVAVKRVRKNKKTRGFIDASSVSKMNMSGNYFTN